MKNDLNLSRLFRSVDRRIIILILVGVISTLLLQRLIINPTESRITAVTSESADLSESTIALEERVQEIISGGTASIDDVISRVILLETSIPSKVDDLVLTAELFQLGTVGITLDSISESKASPPASKTGLSYMLYDVSGTGTLGSIKTFLEETALTGTHIITVDQLKVNLATKAKSNQVGMTANATPLVDFEARLRVWYDSNERLFKNKYEPAQGKQGELTSGGGVQQPAQPGATQPKATQPGINQPAQPGPNQPGANQPGANQPGINQPAQPGATQPGPTQPGGNQPGGQQGGLTPGQQVLPGQPDN